MTSNFRQEVEIRPFRACAMHPAIIIGTVRSLWTWLWGRYHVSQNVFLVVIYLAKLSRIWSNLVNSIFQLPQSKVNVFHLTCLSLNLGGSFDGQTPKTPIISVTQMLHGYTVPHRQRPAAANSCHYSASYVPCRDTMPMCQMSSQLYRHATETSL